MSIFIGIFFRGCFYDNAYDNVIFTLSFSRGRKRRSHKRCPNGNVLILALITPLRTPIFNFRVLLRLRRLWKPALTLSSYNVRNSVLIVPHITLWDCRVHSFSDNRFLEIVVYKNAKAHNVLVPLFVFYNSGMIVLTDGSWPVPGLHLYIQLETRDRDARAGPRTALPCYSATPVSTPTYKSWIIDRLDRRLADVIGSNTVEKCDVTLSRTIKPYTHLTDYTNKKRIPLRDFSYFSTRYVASRYAGISTNPDAAKFR